MGLNLNIGRVLFRQILKFSGELTDDALEGVDEAYRADAKRSRLQPVEAQLVKQIAGRAGRMATAFSDRGGGVAAMDARDLKYVTAALEAPKLRLLGVVDVGRELLQGHGRRRARGGHALAWPPASGTGDKHTTTAMSMETETMETKK